jgi:hypothetical protein
VSKDRRYLFRNKFIFTKQVKADVYKNLELLIDLPCTEFHPITSTRAFPVCCTRGNPLNPTIVTKRNCEHSLSLHRCLQTQTEICLRCVQTYDCCRPNQRNSKLQMTHIYSRVIQKTPKSLSLYKACTEIFTFQFARQLRHANQCTVCVHRNGA